MHFQMHFLGLKYAFLGPGAATATELTSLGFTGVVCRVVFLLPMPLVQEYSQRPLPSLEPRTFSILRTVAITNPA